MNAQDVFLGERVAHVRELKAEVAALRAQNAALRDENASLKAHLDLAVLAMEDLRGGRTLEIWDGWNLLLGSKKVASGRAALVAQAAKTGRRIWIVLDGHDETVRNDGLVRVSYTGGVGEHRADRFVCDYVRMAAYLGLAGGVAVRTNDKDFRARVRRLGARLVD